MRCAGTRVVLSVAVVRRTCCKAKQRHELHGGVLASTRDFPNQSMQRDRQLIESQTRKIKLFIMILTNETHTFIANCWYY